MNKEDKLLVLLWGFVLIAPIVVHIGIITPLNKIARKYPPDIVELIMAKQAECPDCRFIYVPLFHKYFFVEDRTPILPKIGLSCYLFTKQVTYPKKIIEQINNNTFKIIIGLSHVNLPCKYLTFNLTVRLKSKKHDKYFIITSADRGNWFYMKPNGSLTGNLTIYHVRIRSAEDKQIIKKIAKRILAIAKEYKMNRSELLELTRLSVLSLINPYKNRWRDIHNQTIEIRVFNRTAKRFETIKIRNPDTDLKWVLLKGGVCWDCSVVAALLLNELGIKTYVIVYISPEVCHAIIGLPENHSDVKIQYDNKTVYLKVIEPQWSFDIDYAPFAFEKGNKVIIYEIEDFTSKTQR